MKRLLAACVLLLALPAGARMLGTNTDTIRTSDGSMPMCDLVKMSSADWVKLTTGDYEPAVNADGWITGFTGTGTSDVNARVRASFLIDLDHTDVFEYCDVNENVIPGATSGTRCPANYPRGEYTIDCAGGTAKVGIGRNSAIDETLTCPGSKTFTVDAPLPNSEGLEIIMWTNPGVTGVPKTRVYPSGSNPAACNPDTDLFNPAYAYSFVRSKIKVHRLLGYNPIYIPSVFDGVINWADRPKLSARTYANPPLYAPFELGVLLANQIFEDYGWEMATWFMLPVRSSDSFHTDFANYILATLNPAIDWSVFEWCNECWNFGGSFNAQRQRVLLDAQETQGVATDGSTTSITMTGAGWGTNAYATMEVHVTDVGTGGTARRTITSNTATVLTLSAAISIDVDAGDTFRIYRFEAGEATQILWQQAERSAQVYEIYKGILGLSKIRRVLGIQNKEGGSPSDANTYLNFDPFGALLATKNYFDWVAVAPYLYFGDCLTTFGKHTQNATDASYDGISNDQCGTDAAHRTNDLNSGTVTSGTTTTVVKTGAGWTPSAFSSVSAQVCVNRGAVRSCSIATANTIDTITVSPAFSFDVDALDTYKVLSTAEFACCGDLSCPGIREWVPDQYCASMQCTIEAQRQQVLIHKTAVEAHTNLEGNMLKVALYEGGTNHDDRLGGSDYNLTGEHDPVLVRNDHAGHRGRCYEQLFINYANMLETLLGPDVPLVMLTYISKWNRFQNFGFSEYLFHADGRNATCRSPTMRGAINWANEVP